MFLIALPIVFVFGYLLIAFEHGIKINKAASALCTAMVLWTIYMLGSGDHHETLTQLSEQVSDIAGIIFFLMGAMTIVELMDAHDAFEVITSRIKTRSITPLIWIVGNITFFLSSILDNLTTAIVMVTLLKKLDIRDKDLLVLVGLVVIAANAGGAWSPIGDVTTTMLWIGGQITPLAIILKSFIPSAACFVVPAIILSFTYAGKSLSPNAHMQSSNETELAPERTTVLVLGVAALIAVPIFKTLTHLPPFMGMIGMLGVLWIITELMHKRKTDEEKKGFSVLSALHRIDMSSVLFFLGILLCVGALQAAGHLTALASLLDSTFKSDFIICFIIGVLSSIIDNVPLVAAAMGMYPLSEFAPDSRFWILLAYCAGTGGSILVIGSAAGVAAMGLTRITFFGYLRAVTPLAIAGYCAGALLFWLGL